MFRTPTLLALALLLVVPACQAPAPTPAPGAGVRISDDFTLGEPFAVMNLTVWPVYTDEPLDVGEFLTLPEAIETGQAEIREVGAVVGQGAQNDVRQTAQVVQMGREVQTEDGFQTMDIPAGNINPGGATVNTLEIENRGDLPILVCAGTLVKGGQQDRQIGEDIVIAAKSTVPVPAFCVEQGRWTNDRSGQVTNGKFVTATMNALPGVRAKGQYVKNQGEVWQEVALANTYILQHAVTEKVERGLTAGIYDNSSFPNAVRMMRTSSLAVVLDANDELMGKEVAKYADAVRKHFATLGDDPVGFAYAVDGEPVNVRTFAHHRVFAGQFDPFVETMSTEAFLAQAGREEGETVPIAKAEDIARMVAEIEAAEEKMVETRAANINGKRIAESGYNSNCYYDDGGDGDKKRCVTRDWTKK